MKTLMMKLALATVMTVAAASAAHADGKCYGDMQFFGIARNVESCAQTGGVVRFNVEFTRQPNFNDGCSIVQEDVKTKVTSLDCSIQEGREISGVLKRLQDGSIIKEL